MATDDIGNPLQGPRTPAKVKAALASVRKRATNAQIEAWCSRAGRWPKTSEKLHKLVTNPNTIFGK
jgi:hypothetical protein